MTSLRKSMPKISLPDMPEPSDDTTLRWINDQRVVLTDGDLTLRATVHVTRDTTYVCVNGRTFAMPNEEGGRAAAVQAGSEKSALSPMTGLLAQVHVATGDVAAEGAALFVVEAMKMEYVVRAPRDVTIDAVNARAGSQVELGAEIVTFVDDDEGTA